MQLQTILNRVYPFKSFCYADTRFNESGDIEVLVRPRANGKPICSGCGHKRPGYDTLAQRRYQFLDVWNLPVYLCYCPRRVQCPTCRVKIERVPWADGKSPQTTARVWFLAFWAKWLSWQQVAQQFGSSWTSVYRCVATVVAWGLAERSLDGIGAIGVDEVAWQRGHQYLTLVYQLDDGHKRLLHVSEGRTKESLKDFLFTLGKDRAEELEFACTDMWPAYLDVIERYTPAVNILDRFHIMKKFNEAIDQIRRAEMKKAKEAGYEWVLKNSRWCLLKNRENLTDKQLVKLKELLKYNLPPVKAYLLREQFQRFWGSAPRLWISVSQSQSNAAPAGGSF